MKAAWLREDVILDDSYVNFMDHIRSKYGVIPGGGDRPKGVGQLARSVGAIVRGEWRGAQNEFTEPKLIYPVLLVHDTRMDAPATGPFLHAEFLALLGPVPTGKHVAPLIIITIKDLENLETSISTFALGQLLDDYNRDCPDRVRSLHNYIAHSTYGQKIEPSEQLKRNSFELAANVHRELFPPKAESERP